MEQSSPKKYQNCYLVAAILFLTATSVTMMQYKIPTIMTSVMRLFSIDSTTAAWTMSIFTFVGIVFALPIGKALMKVGPRAIILLSVLIDVVASIVGAFAPDMGSAGVVVLLITRAMEGLSLTGVVACCPVVIQQCVAPEKNGTANGIYMLGGMLGATFGGILTPILFSSIGFRGLWLSYAGIAAVAGVLFALGVKFPSRVNSQIEDAEGSHTPVSVFIKPNTILFYVSFAVFQVLLLAVLSWAPTALQQRGMSPEISGFVSTLPMLLAVVSSIAFGALCDKMRKCKPLFLIASVCMAVCTPIMLNIDGALMWCTLVVMGLTAMGLPTVAIAAYPQILGNPAYLSMGMGVLMLVQNIGQFLGSLVPSLLLGPAIDGWLTCGVVLGIIGLLSSVGALLCKFR